MTEEQIFNETIGFKDYFLRNETSLVLRDGDRVIGSLFANDLWAEWVEDDTERDPRVDFRIQDDIHEWLLREYEELCGSGVLKSGIGEVLDLQLGVVVPEYQGRGLFKLLLSA